MPPATAIPSYLASEPYLPFQSARMVRLKASASVRLQPATISSKISFDKRIGKRQTQTNAPCRTELVPQLVKVFSKNPG